jgi:hypothetical protein
MEIDQVFSSSSDEEGINPQQAVAHNQERRHMRSMLMSKLIEQHQNEIAQLSETRKLQLKRDLVSQLKFTVSNVSYQKSETRKIIHYDEICYYVSAIKNIDPEWELFMKTRTT